MSGDHSGALKLYDDLVQSSPPNSAPPLTASPPIPPLIFKSQICFFLVIYDSFYCRFPIPRFFSPVPRAAVLGGVDCNCVLCDLYILNCEKPGSRGARCGASRGLGHCFKRIRALLQED